MVKIQLVLNVLFLAVVLPTRATVEEDTAQCLPQHVHLSYGETPDTMVIMWATVSPCTTGLYYGTSAWHLDQFAPGNSTVFTEQNFKGLQNLHRVKIQNLRSATTYHYRPMSNKIGRGPFYFKTPPSGNNWAPEVLVYGDLGVQSASFPSLTEEALKGEYAAVLHLGDFGYNLKDSDGLVGDQFMKLIEPIASFLPYMTCPGNHEIDSDTFTHYRHRFSMPGTTWPMRTSQLWYSFNLGPVHFVSYSSEVFFTLGGHLTTAQYDWLVDDLTKANRQRPDRPWIVAFGHRPMYCSSTFDNDCNKNDSLVRAGLEELFYHYGVDLVLQAHEHSYERLYPMFKGVVVSANYTDPRASVQIISGAAGSKFGPDPMQSHSIPAWSAVHVGNKSLNSYGRLRVANATHLYWEQRSVESDLLVDSFWLVQRRHGRFDLKNLPEDVSQQISKNMEAAGETPGILNVKDPDVDKAELVGRDRTQRLAIGISFGVLFLIVIGGFVFSRVCRRRRYTFPRGWEMLDVDYGRKLYAPVREEEDEHVDFEVDMSDSKKIHARRLLNGN